jgi:hypothetical protein
MGCPEGTDEECAILGIGMICYDLTGNDLICEEAGVGVKEKGDPQTVSLFVFCLLLCCFMKY